MNFQHWLLILLLFSPLTQAEETKNHSFSFTEELSSPVTTDARYPFYLAAGATAILLLLEDQVSDPTQKDVSEDHPLGSFSRFGDLMGQMIPNALYTIAFYSHAYMASNKSSKDRGKLMFKATAYSGAVTTALKYTVRERRPSGGNSKVSFPSGHTTTIFAFASVVGAEHDWYWGVGAYALAGMVAFSRMNDNEHYLHDVFGGATIGMSYGLGLYYQKKMSEDKINETSWFLHPLPTDQLDGLICLASKRF